MTISRIKSDSLANTAVTPASYGAANAIPQFSVDEKGRITSVTNVTVETGGSIATILMLAGM